MSDDIDKRLAEIKAKCAVDTLGAKIDQLTQWVHDCQSGMYINCVYCGHRYGPKGSFAESIEENTPRTMQDALREHVENCPKHPMSALKRENVRLVEQLDAARARIDRLVAAFESRSQEHSGLVSRLRELKEQTQQAWTGIGEALGDHVRDD